MIEQDRESIASLLSRIGRTLKIVMKSGVRMSGSVNVFTSKDRGEGEFTFTVKGGIGQGDQYTIQVKDVARVSLLR